MLNYSPADKGGHKEYSCPMRAVVQRVKSAEVSVEGRIKGSIGQGFLVLLGIENSDSPEDGEWLAGKIARLRVFNDSEGVMNLPIGEIGGEMLVVSQFTLHANVRKGNRPSYNRAAKPDKAVPLYEAFVKALEAELGRDVPTGTFGAIMEISLVCDGPVTIIIDSRD